MMKMFDYVKKTPKKIKENIIYKEDLIQSLVSLFLKSNFVSVIIVASGSSMNAAEMAKPYLVRRLNCSISVMSPELFELTKKINFSQTFVFFISQSGASTNILHAIKYFNNDDYPTILLTGNIHSELAKYADIVIDYGVGKETVGYVTLGLSTLILYLSLFANKVAEEQGREYDSDEAFSHLSDLMQITIDRASIFIKDHFLELAEMGPTFICGNNMNLGVAREAALKFQETLKIPTMHYEIEEFMHGPDIQLDSRYTVFLVDNPIASKRIITIFKNLSAVTRRHYLITCNQDLKGENIINIPQSTIADLCSLVTIPFFQVIVANMMPALNRERANPLAEKFMNLVPTKDYHENK